MSEHGFDASYWDARYREHDSVWGLAPNRWVERETADLPAGRVTDLACGEGRNAIWLATRGWRATAVDFSAVAVEKGRAAAETAGVQVDWRVADARHYTDDEPQDLVLLCYLQLPAAERREAVRRGWELLAPGGTLLVVAHDSRNLTEGTGGPQRPEVLYTAADVTADLDGHDVVVETASVVERPVEGAGRPALDALFRGRRPA